MSHRKTFLSVYRGLLRQVKQVPEEHSLVIRKPVDTDAFRRASYSWAAPADGAMGWNRSADIALADISCHEVVVPAEVCRETLKDLTPFLTEIPDDLTRTALLNTVRSSFKSGVNAAEGEKHALQDTSFQALRALSDQVAMMHCSSSTTTGDINVDVTTAHITESESHHMFTYRCRIENRGQKRIQLLGRHWQFRNAEDAVVQEVPKGSPGVVGNTPILTPGTCFEYHSAATLPTSTGSMTGSFQMMNLDTAAFNHFDAQIARTQLLAPQS